MPLSTLVTSISPPASSETSKKRRQAITTVTVKAWRNLRPISREGTRTKEASKDAPPERSYRKPRPEQSQGR
jgi:hypothetical protein